MYGIIKENPYRLADDIQGVGFKMADEIAQKVGIFTDSDFRIRSGIYYTPLQSVANGHTYLPQEELLASASELLHVDPSVMEKHLTDLQMEKKIVVKVNEEKVPESEADRSSGISETAVSESAPALQETDPEWMQYMGNGASETAGSARSLATSTPPSTITPNSTLPACSTT